MKTASGERRTANGKLKTLVILSVGISNLYPIKFNNLQAEEMVLCLKPA